MTSRLATAARYGAAVLTFVLCTPTATALANPAVDAVEDFFTWARATGTSAAEYESLTETGPNDAILRGAKLVWKFDFEIFDQRVEAEVSFESPETRFFGASSDGNGVAFERFEQPGVHEIRLTGTVTEDGKPQSLDLTVRQYDLVAENMYQAYWSLEEAPERPASRFIPVLRSGLQNRAESISVRAIEAISQMPDGARGTERQERISMTGLANGRLEEYRIGHALSESKVVMDNGEMFSLRQETGESVTTGIDVKPMLRIVGISLPDRAAGTSVIESSQVNDIKYNSPFFNAAIQKISAEGAEIAADAVPFDLFPFLDTVILGTFEKTYGPDELIELGRKAVTSLEGVSIDRMAAEGLAITSDEGNASLDNVSINDASYGGFGDFSMSGLSVRAAQDITSVDLERFRISDFDLPPLASYVDFGVASQDREPSLTEILAVVPMLGQLEVEALKVASDALPGGLSLDRFRISMRDFIAPIPTDIEVRTEGLKMPVALVEEEEARKLFESLGLSSLRYNDEMRLRWDADDKTLTLDPMRVEIDGGGSLDLSAEVGGIPRTVFENPGRAQMALATATINHARLEIRDAKLVSAFIAGQAKAADLSPETLALALADQGASALGPLRDTPFGQSLHGAMKAFLVAPDHLILTVEPKTPVPAMQILGLVVTTPSMLPGLLNAAVAANP
ncbi:hypothetical protein [Stappia sp. ES.058]|uniref:hypothetical protein n=1 Tax=Stappia sp. ES.058 TaxID=1881061 RepID=UPI00087B9471|nr:hypothetical protein [Stappia sp. ES.058]SDU13117.1 hypothetical protein SAMN05428979_1809 [Stappia sp. ES.058]